MSTYERDQAPGMDDATAVRRPVSQEQPSVLPQPRAADPYPGYAAEPAAVSAPYGQVGDLGATAVRPTAAPTDAPTWGSAATPTPPAPPAWSGPAATPPPPPSRPQSGPIPAQPLPARTTDTHTALLGVLIAAIVLIAGGGGFYLTWSHKSPTSTSSSPTTDFSGSLPAGGTSDPGTSAGGTSSDTSTDGDTSSSSVPDTNTAPTTAAAPTVDPEAAALDQLNALHSNSVARVALDGRWVAQVASKSVGITDPLQTTQTGGHMFMAADILAESLQARQTVSNPDLNVYVLWGTDFGKRSQAPNGSPYWITLVDAGFSSSNAVTGWCRSTYSSLTPAQLADTCAPRQLTTPHS